MQGQRLPDINGQKFGRLLALGEAGRRKPRERRWHVRCDCGIEKIVLLRSLVSGWTKSCGCLQREIVRVYSQKINHKKVIDSLARVAAINETGKKQCPRCKEIKHISSFTPSRWEITGLTSWCKICVHDNALRRMYGITLADKFRMIDEQGGRCANRGCLELVDVHSSVDHCHTSGRVRGVLCRACNKALGLLKEDPGRIEGLAGYIRQ